LKAEEEERRRAEEERLKAEAEARLKVSRAICMADAARALKMVGVQPRWCHRVHVGATECSHVGATGSWVWQVRYLLFGPPRQGM